jgi:hypothetical protein
LACLRGLFDALWRRRNNRFGCLLALAIRRLRLVGAKGGNDHTSQRQDPYKGQPLTKGTVTFEPDGAGKEATGEIQADGTFVLSTYKKDDGAVLGNHRVTVSNVPKTIPAKYSSPATSKLEMEVSEGKTDYTIELK